MKAGNAELVKIDTTDNIADIMTKPNLIPTFEKLAAQVLNEQTPETLPKKRTVSQVGLEERKTPPKIPKTEPEEESPTLSVLRVGRERAKTRPPTRRRQRRCKVAASQPHHCDRPTHTNVWLSESRRMGPSGISWGTNAVLTQPILLLCQWSHFEL